MADSSTLDVIVIGAGAAGLHCAATAAKRGKRVLVLDHAKQAGKKILISGGGRCNFTNMYASAENFLSENPHFCKSALSRYTQWDFIGLVNDYGIAYHEKTLGQLFCDHSAKDIVAMLMAECSKYGAKVQLRTEVQRVEATADGYVVHTSSGMLQASKLVVACGGLSMPKLGATPLGYQIAEQFGHRIVPVRAGLVPFTLHEADKERYAELSGLAVDVVAENERASFKEALLFTHRGVSGPSMLQISSYWFPGETVSVNLLPDEDCFARLNELRQSRPRMSLRSVIQEWFPKRLALTLCDQYQWPDKNLADCTNSLLQRVADTLHAWQLKPNGTEGYRTAEVTLGGVDTNQVSSKTMESRLQPGLFFIGEVIDVTGWLGGYNFQWAWSSGWVCGESV
ncbi:NAD(P)/FAD-dependent oxidoreductase [Pseudidiomarina gelatinasegens]|jgi:predicted Rossmann fold flavoprotein|uniref:NAD(P)/FAD-dependent oxidoreductase n=1 Tax=Pseudidiomarina gelatinasegens TaxID=2487740 RepID=A0A443YZ05_9GAMM|nr:NAD(P)/FAD-dependent oxidoreductase [Pseudidiomarina gelatinasegens]RWU09326.1 NAD(P)/FAD-dependent oxidoreductase [Pseudidiomarina gelatinasegens]|tara:strand:- start:210 stop:1400 length:1191 start_codon:yes stop_codon:yes gene_type:complete